MKKNLIHICEEFEYTWIGKDNGMIPIYMKMLDEYEVSILTCDFKKDLPDEVRGVKILKIDRWIKKIKNFLPFIIFIKRIPLYYYLIKNSKKIDVLMLFHVTKCSYWNAYFYKKMNPQGKIYVKADFSLELYRKEIATTEMKITNLREFFRRNREIKEYKKRKKLINLLDLLSYENIQGYEAMKNSYAGIECKEKTIYLPNGYDDEYIDKNIKIKTFKNKENIFLTVGRLGTTEKNTELLLEILEEIDLKNWKFYLIGSIEKGFKEKIESFYTRNPNKKDNIIFTGEIKDKNILYDYYNRAKVFVMPSRRESFGIVMVEAMAFGNYIITSNTSAANDITNFGEVGKIYEEKEKLILEIKEIINDNVDLENKMNDTLKYKDKFRYSELIKELNENIK